mgnify:CR=1 FL=1
MPYSKVLIYSSGVKLLQGLSIDRDCYAIGRELFQSGS